MEVVTRELLAQLSEEARLNPRLRKNRNFHPGDDSRCHRLLNAVEPDSYIRPHRHADPEKDEGFIIMSGRLGIVTFSDIGEVVEAIELSHAGGTLAAGIPHGVFHTAFSLESGTVFYEVKAGPYRVLTAQESAPWAPVDGDPRVPLFLAQLRALFD